MRKNVFFTAMIFYLTLSSVLSQHFFSKYYDIVPQKNEYAHKVIQTGSGYCLIGNSIVTINHKDKPSMYFCNINTEGEIINIMNHEYLYFTGSKSVIKENDDIYIAATDNRNIEYERQIHIYHTNTNGDSIDLIPINLESDLIIENVGLIKTGDTLYLLNHLRKNPDIIVETGEYRFFWGVTQFMAVNTKGEILFDRRIQLDLEGFIPYGMVKSDKNKFYLYVKNDSQRYIDMHVPVRTKLYRYDSKGKYEWKKRILVMSRNGRITRSKPSIIHFDNHFYVNYQVNDKDMYVNSIFKLDSLADVQWEYLFGNPSDGFSPTYIIEGLHHTEDSFIIAYGQTNNDYYVVPWISKLDTSGNMIWKRYILKDVRERFFPVHFLSCLEDDDNNLVFPGNYRPGGSPEKNFHFSFFIKLNSEGCATDDCDSLVVQIPYFVSTINELLRIDPKIIIYPNPVTDKIELSAENMRLTNWSIINESGNLIKNGIFHSENSITGLGNLKPGIYFLILKDKKGTLESKKFIKN